MLNQITLYNPNQIIDRVLNSGKFELKEFQEIPPVMVKQILDSENMDNPVFKENIKMVQRLKINDNGISYDYMGSSEFESGLVGETNAKIINWINSGQAVYIKNGNIEAICHISMKEEVLIQIEELLNNKHRLKEPMFHEETHSNFLCIDNAYVFSTDGNGNKLLMHLKATGKLNKHYDKIRKYPKYIELQELCREVKIFLNENELDVFYVGINTRYISNKSFGREITDEDFEGNIISLNASGSRYIRDFSASEKDLKDCLEGKGNMYTDRYYLDNGDLLKVSKSNNLSILESILYKLENDEEGKYRDDINNILINLANNKSINRDFINKLFHSTLDINHFNPDLRFILTRNIHTDKTVLERIRKSCKNKTDKEKYTRLINQREAEINTIAEKTLESIKALFLEGTYINIHSGEQQQSSKPSRTYINFLNGMSSIGFKVKDNKLNTYYPKNQPLSYNQIMIWNPHHEGGRIYTGEKNYEGIKKCIDLTEITGEKFISYENITGKDKIDTFSFNTHHGYGMYIEKYFSNTKGLQNINLSTIFWSVNQISHTKHQKNPSKEIKRIMDMCKKNVSIEDIELALSINTIDGTFEYLCENFPGELPEKQYLQFAKNLDVAFKKELERLKTYY